MKNVVFDSFALLSLIFDESDAEVVADYFKKALQDRKRIYICTANWSEVMYHTIWKRGRGAWKTVQMHLHNFPFEIVDADLALTKIKKAELVTGDPEFKPLEGVLKKIVWLKQRLYFKAHIFKKITLFIIGNIIHEGHKFYSTEIIYLIAQPLIDVRYSFFFRIGRGNKWNKGSSKRILNFITIPGSSA